MSIYTGKWAARLACLLLAGVAFTLIYLNVSYYFRDILSPLGFVLTGLMFSLIALARKGTWRAIAVVGLIVWAVPGWGLGYGYASTYLHDTVLILFAATLPYFFIGLVFLVVHGQKSDGGTL